MTFPLMPFSQPIQTSAGSLVGSGTFTVPLGITSLSFTIRGGGGGAGGSATASNINSPTRTALGGGGGTGATVVGTISVVPGDVIVATLGTRGTNGSSVSTQLESTSVTAPSGNNGSSTQIQKNGTPVATANGGLRGFGATASVDSSKVNSATAGAGGAGGTIGTGGTVTSGASGGTGAGTQGPVGLSTITWG